MKTQIIEAQPGFNISEKITLDKIVTEYKTERINKLKDVKTNPQFYMNPTLYEKKLIRQIEEANNILIKINKIYKYYEYEN